MTHRFPHVLLSLFAASTGCILPHDLEWEISWEDSSLADQAAAIEARLFEGGCPGDALVWVQETDGLDGNWDDPPTLGEGRYGFAARARDAQCRWYAAGCRTLDLPASNDGRVVVVLSAITPVPECAPELCVAGQCDCGVEGGCDETCVGDDCTCLLGGCTLSCPEGGDCSCVGGHCDVHCPADAVCSCPGGGCEMNCEGGSRCTCDGGNCHQSCDDDAACSCLGGGCS